MKKIILFTGAICFLIRSTAQDSAINHTQHLSTNPPVQTKPIKDSRDYFLAKSKKTKTTAIVLLSAGAVVGGLGLYFYQQSINQEYNLEQMDDAIVNTGAPYIAMIAGTAMMTTSIPLFFASAHYKKKAMSMSASLKMEPYQSVSLTGMFTKRYPSLGFVIHF